MTIIGVALGRTGIGVGGIGVSDGGSGVKVGKNLNCVGVGSSGESVEKSPEIRVMVGGTSVTVSDGALPDEVAVTAPCSVGVPCA